MDAFLLTCLFSESEVCTREIYNEIEENNQTIIREGRRKDVEIKRNGESILYKNYLANIFDQMSEVIHVIDNGSRKDDLLKAIDTQRNMLDPTNTLSQRVFDLSKKMGFAPAMMGLAKEHRQELFDNFNNQVFQDELEEEKFASVQRQVDFEKLDDVDFETYVAEYVDSSFSKKVTE